MTFDSPRVLFILTCLDMEQFKLPFEKSEVKTTSLAQLGPAWAKEVR